MTVGRVLVGIGWTVGSVVMFFVLAAPGWCVLYPLKTPRPLWWATALFAGFIPAAVTGFAVSRLSRARLLAPVLSFLGPFVARVLVDPPPPLGVRMTPEDAREAALLGAAGLLGGVIHLIHLWITRGGRRPQ
jgi:hypothetical protein